MNKNDYSVGLILFHTIIGLLVYFQDFTPFILYFYLTMLFPWVSAAFYNLDTIEDTIGGYMFIAIFQMIFIVIINLTTSYYYKQDIIPMDKMKDLILIFIIYETIWFALMKFLVFPSETRKERRVKTLEDVYRQAMQRINTNSYK